MPRTIPNFVVLYKWKRRHAHQQSVYVFIFSTWHFLPRRSFPHYIISYLVVQIQCTFVNTQFQKSLTPTLLSQSSSYLLPLSVIPSVFHLIYNCQLSRSTTGIVGISQISSDGCASSGSRNSHGSAWLFWKLSIIKPAAICSERYFSPAHQPL